MLDIIRAWKDEAYRNSLSEAERAQLPDNPAGTIKLTDDELTDVSAGRCANSCFEKWAFIDDNGNGEQDPGEQSVYTNKCESSSSA